MTLYRVLLKQAAQKALLSANTFAGQSVIVDRSLPATSDKLPAIILTTPRDSASSSGRNPEGFTRVTTLAVRGLLTGNTPEEAGQKIDLFAEQIELALMLDTALQSMITQVTSLETETMLNSQTAEHTGEVRMLLGLEYMEYYPATGTPLTELVGDVQANGNAEFAHFQVPLTS